MGEEADRMFDEMLFDNMFDTEDDIRTQEDYEHFIKNRIWIMRDGTEIKTEDMGTEHIENALALLRRRGATGSPISPFILFFVEELKKRSKGPECPVCSTGKPGCPNCGTKR